MNGEFDINSSAEQLTPEITKITLVESQSNKLIPWAKGMSAKFYFKCFAYVVPSIQDNKDNGNKHEHQGHNHEHQGHKHDEAGKCCSVEAQKEKMKLLEELLDQSKDKKKEVSNQKPSTLPPTRVLIADSRVNDPKPFELRIGYSFSVKAMEICVKTMKIGEKARFLCMPGDHVEGFLQLEQIMRQERVNRELADAGKPLLNTFGCSAHMSPEMMAVSEGLEDAIGSPLEFEFELISAEMPGEFEKETWEFTPEEKYSMIEGLKSRGAEYYKQKDWLNSLKQYQKALELLEALETSVIVMDLKKDKFDRSRGKIGSETIEPSIIKLDQVDEWMIQCRLNYAACKLKLKDYRSVIVQCTRVLSLDSKSPKALFRRGQAYMELGRDLDLAEKDFIAMHEIVKGTALEKELAVVQGELRKLFKAHSRKEQSSYAGMFS